MANCPKCGVISENPIKTWKVKQTSMGLFECPSCKTKWRRKAIVISTITPSVAQALIPELKASFPAPTVNDGKELQVKETTVQNTTSSPHVSTSPFSGIKQFLSYLFGL